MKNVYQVLREKELELQRVRDEVAALHIVVPLLADAGEWFERGGVLAPVTPNDSEPEKDVVQKPAVNPPRQPLIPLIPFSAELQRIGETIETVAEVANALETPVNTGYYR